MTVATKRKPTEVEWGDLLFSWRVCKHVRSNAIVLASGGVTAGIGAGQMSRVDSVRLAIEKTQLDSLDGASLASDAYFPFADGPDLAIRVIRVIRNSRFARSRSRPSWPGSSDYPDWP